MNLTFTLLAKVSLTFSFLLAAGWSSAQPQSRDLPESYHYLLKGVEERNVTSVSTYLVSSNIKFDSSAMTLLRRMNDWIIIRVDQQYKEIDKKGWLVNDLWKLSDPNLLNHNGRQLFTIKLTDEELVHQFDESTIRYYKYPYLKMEASAQEMEAILGLASVVYIGLESDLAKEESRVLDLNLIPNNIPLVRHTIPDLKGNQVAVGIKEQLFDLEDVDLKGRVYSGKQSSELMSDHATEMATIIGGAGITFINSLGVAPMVSMYSSDFVELMPDEDAFYNEHDIVIQNHSYGGVIESFYGASAEAYDRLANQRPELLHVMSSGNSGLEAPVTGVYKDITGWANLTGNYKNAKNNIVVGAVDTTGTVMPFSSVGPAADGRIKPEVVAYSTAGTSNAAALVSGVAVLLQEHYGNLNSVVASSDLIKALLINGCTDVGLPGIDFRSGFGNVDAYASVRMLDEGQYFQETTEKGNSSELVIDIPENAINLKITLVWNDPAGLANDINPLVNDLDLRVIDPNSDIWLPWVLDHSANESSLNSIAERKKDHLNNVEQVFLDKPADGLFKIVIDGENLSTNSQAFSVVYDFQLVDRFEWEYPLKSSFMPYDGETGSYFRWNSTFEDEFGALYLSSDQGNTWELLLADLDLNKGFSRWEPKGLTGLARAKIQVGGQEFETDDFVISHTLSLNSGFHCSDSVMIHWPPESGVEKFELYHLDEQGFELVQSTSDTSAILEGDDWSDQYFKVVPKFDSQMKGVGSYLFIPGDIGTDCYLTSFFGYKNEHGVLLNTHLTSLHGVSAVRLENIENGEFHELYEYELENHNKLEYLDDSPKEGVNVYRANVLFDNGEVLTSDTVQLIYLNELVAMLYPNPMESGSSLAIQTNLSGEKESTLRIFDLHGHEHVNAKLSELEYLSLGSNLVPGIYVFHVENEEGHVSGRLIVR